MTAAAEHTPERGSNVEAWLKRQRDRYKPRQLDDCAWDVLDDLLDEYRLHADTGTPLSGLLSEPVAMAGDNVDVTLIRAEFPERGIGDHDCVEHEPQTIRYRPGHP